MFGLLSTATPPARNLLLHGFSMGCSFNQGMFACYSRGSFTGYSADICSTVVLHGLQKYCLLYNGLHHRLQGNLCSNAWSTFSHAFFSVLGVRRAVFLIYLSLFSLTASAQCFLLFLQRTFSEATILAEELSCAL